MADTAANVIQFGSIVLSNVLTTSYREEEITDPSGTNVMFVRHRIIVQATLASGLPPAESNEGPGDVMAALRRYMLRHRRYFLYAMSGKKVVEVGSSGAPDDPSANMDVENGPKCLWISAINVADACISIEASFEVCLVPCDGQTRSILSHVFSQREEYDDAGYCTLTTSGIIISRRDIQQTPTQILEGAGLPKIRAGYTRKAKTFTLSEDGLRITYQIRDQEHHLRPPEGAVSTAGQFSISTSPSGSGAQGTLYVRLRGFKEITKQKLFELGIRIYRSKVSTIRHFNEKNEVSQQQASVAEELFENVIELRFNFLCDEKKVRLLNGKGDFRSGILGPNYRPDGQPSVSTPLNEGEGHGAREEVLRDGQLVEMLRSELQEPCENLAVVRQSSGRSRSPSKTEQQLAGLIGSDGVTPGPVAGGGSISPEQIQAILSGNGRTIAGAFGVELPSVGGTSSGLVPAGEPSLMEQYRPEPGGVTGPANNEFGAFGSNEVQNSGYARPRIDPPDLDFPYTVYRVKISHQRNTGKRVTPGCGPIDKKRGRLPRHPVAAVHHPSLDVFVTWTAERVGAPPQIPDPCAGDPNVVLITERVDTEEDRRVPSGERRWIVSGAYHYQVREPELFPLLQAFPPFLIGDALADAAAGLSLDRYTKARSILWTNLKTIPAPPFFGDCGESSPGERSPGLAGTLAGSLVGVPSSSLPGGDGGAASGVGVLGGLLGGLLGGELGGYNPNPGG